MSTLFAFGCSFTEEFHDTPHQSLQRKYVQEFLNNEYPDAWPTILAKQINFNVKNYGHGGISNNEIFDRVCSHCDEFKRGDIVIVGWTNRNRFRWAKPEENGGGWFHVLASYVSEENINHLINKNTLIDILVNREDYVYIDEIYKFQKILDELSKSVGFDVYYWAIDNILINKLDKNLLINKKYLCTDLYNDNICNIHNCVIFNGGSTIETHTKGMIPDSHLSKDGHIVQAGLFYEHIKKYQDII